MSKITPKKWTPFVDVDRKKQKAQTSVATQQLDSPAYRLAYTDLDFIKRPELRPLRIALELEKVEIALQEHKIESTVVLFGGARIPEPGKKADAAKNATQQANLKKASHYYQEARQFARLCSQYSSTLAHKEFVIVTGGGPGVMEAGNRGAADVGAPSIGLNVVLPHEQAPNRYVTPELCFQFHYFAMRKMHFLIRAKAMAIFPGGFGTMDELFETLTLIQTQRMKRLPILLFGNAFWTNVLNIQYLAEQGMISPDDVELLSVVENAQQGWDIIRKFYSL